MWWYLVRGSAAKASIPGYHDDDKDLKGIRVTERMKDKIVVSWEMVLE